MKIYINQIILERILNDNVEDELQQIIDKELSKPLSQINCSKISDRTSAICSMKRGNI